MSAGNAEMLWTSQEAIAATSGQCAVDWQAAGVSIDSRSIKTGDLFVALQGPNHDGHDYIESALKRDAAATMVHAKPGTVASNAPVLVVKDTMTALESLGAASRKRTAAKIIAVTGS
ncbi:MAG: Mur ligase domain-containing protein, partial [Rhodospirillales bacterium]